MLRGDRHALVQAVHTAQRAADYILDRQPAGAAGERGVERQRDREQEAGTRGEEDGRVSATLPAPSDERDAGRDVDPDHDVGPQPDRRNVAIDHEAEP